MHSSSISSTATTTAIAPPSVTALKAYVHASSAASPSSSSSYSSSASSSSSFASEHPIQLPEHFHLVAMPHLIQLVADMLQRLTTLNDRIPLHQSTLTRFHSRGAPQISLVDYLQRIVRYAAIEPICLLVLLIYVDRICNRSRTFIVSSLTVHRLVITAFCCASKALCDSYLTNTSYAKIGGISIHELNILELDFLSLIDWDVCCNAELLQTYYVNLVKQHPAFTRKLPPPMRWAGHHHPP